MMKDAIKDSLSEILQKKNYFKKKKVPTADQMGDGGCFEGLSV